MTVLVRVRTGAGRLAVPVSVTRGVIPAEGLRPLPAPAPGVAGLVDHGGAAVPVLAAFGEHGAHVLVLEVDGTRFGVLVDEVIGVQRLPDEALQPAPLGQAERLVAALVRDDAGETMVLDAAVLARRLG